MPRPAVPTKLKILNGNPGKRPINYDEPEPTRQVPKMPKWLKIFKIAVETWKKESKILDEMGVLTLADEDVLAKRCYLASQIQKLALEIETEGHVIELSKYDKNGQLVLSSHPNPKCGMLAKVLVEHRQLGSLLGLDPASRTKLKADRPKRQSKADEFMARKKG